MPRPVWFALVLGACSFAPLDVEGRQCASDGRCPTGLACVHGVCVTTKGSGLTPMMEPAPDAGTMTTAPDAGQSGSPDAGNMTAPDGGVSADGGVDGGVDAGTGEVTQRFSITANGDDVSWCDPSFSGSTPTDEMATADPFFDLSEDDARCQIGLRFVLSLPKGAVIRRAVLQLRRVDGQYASGEIIAVKVFESPNVPQFNDGHRHTPVSHGGVLTNLTVGGFALGNSNGASITSPDLSPLVQSVVNHIDWQPGRAVTFLMGPQTAGPYWVRFEDSQYGDGSPPTLELTWTP